MLNIAKLLPDNLEDKIDSLKLPAWVGPAAEHAVELAEIAGGKPRQKKQRAKEALLAIGKVIDIPGIPEPLEAIIESIVINAAVELAWSLKMGPKSREARRARRAQRRDAT